VPPWQQRVHTYLSAEALSNQTKHLDEERAAIATKTGFEIAGERIEAVTIQIVVVAGVESRAGTAKPYRTSGGRAAQA